QNARLPQHQRDDLNNASMIQRQVTSRFTSADEGLAARLRRMLDDLRNFKMANPDAQKQMEDMLARVNNVRDRNLSPAEQGIAHAVKALDNPPADAGNPPDVPPSSTTRTEDQRSSPVGRDVSKTASSKDSDNSRQQTGTPKEASQGRPEAGKEQSGGQQQAG